MIKKESEFFSDRDNLIVSMGNYLVENNSTVRKVAEKFGISKSTVHKTLTVILRNINYELFKEVEAVLQKNKSERHLRGGMATRIKYLNEKERKKYEI